MKKIRFLIIQLFGISKSEANGAVILLIILLLLLITPFLLNLSSSKSYSSHKSDKALLDSLLSTLHRVDENYVEPESKIAQLTYFDPNKISLEEMMQLGFTSKQAQHISNYRDKNGVFRTKKDLMKIYSIDSLDYLRLAPFILLPEELTKNEVNQVNANAITTTSTLSSSVAPFDVNTADTTAFQRVYGIGSVLSNRIIKYRNLLGGFVTINQLDEIWGLKEETLKKLKSVSFVSPNPAINKININTASYDTLYQHVYINKSIANSIINYRNQHGQYSSVKELKNIHLIDEQLYNKVAPYVTVDK